MSKTDDTLVLEEITCLLVIKVNQKKQRCSSDLHMTGDKNFGSSLVAHSPLVSHMV